MTQNDYGILNHVEMKDGEVQKTYDGNLRCLLTVNNPVLLGHLRPFTNGEQRKNREQAVLSYLDRQDVDCVPQYLGSNADSITMGRIEGENLESVLRTETNTERVRKLVRNSARSLREIHETGIYHADSIPKNAIANAEDDVYFIDFEHRYKPKYAQYGESLDALAFVFRTSVLRDDLPLSEIRREFESEYGQIDTKCLESLAVRTGLLKFASQKAMLKSLLRYRGFKREFMKRNKSN